MNMRFNAQGNKSEIEQKIKDEAAKFEANKGYGITDNIYNSVKSLLSKANSKQTIVVDVTASDEPVTGTFVYVLTVNFL